MNRFRIYYDSPYSFKRKYCVIWADSVKEALDEFYIHYVDATGIDVIQN